MCAPPSPNVYTHVRAASVVCLLGSVSSVTSVPEIYQGVEEVEQQQQAVKQRALCRRMFMDIERQQVREVQRRRDHQKRIDMLVMYYLLYFYCRTIQILRFSKYFAC